MKMTNEKGKLFGIINIVDLLIILAVVSVVFIGYLFLNNKVAEPNDKTRQVITMEITKKRESFCQNIKIGEEAIEVVNNVPIGKIKSVSYKPSEETVVSKDDGTVKKVKVPERFDAKVVVEVTSTEKLQVGKLLSLRTKSFLGNGYIISISEEN